MGFSAPTRQRIGPVLPLAGMVDVLFLLLIFFMTTAVFQEVESQIEVNLPATKSATAQAPKTQIIITVDSKGAIFLGGMQHDLDSLTKTLTALAEQFPNESVLIRGDGDSKLGLTTKILDIVKVAGLKDVALATTRQDPEL